MNKIGNNKGISIPLVLIVALVTIIFGFTSLRMINSEARFNIIDDSNKKAIE